MKPKSFHCDVFVVFFAGVLGLIIGSAAQKTPNETCIFDPAFNRWECCVNVVNTTHGLKCATGQPVRLLNNL